eukprot:g76840.t1
MTGNCSSGLMPRIILMGRSIAASSLAQEAIKDLHGYAVQPRAKDLAAAAVQPPRAKRQIETYEVSFGPLSLRVQPPRSAGSTLPLTVGGTAVGHMTQTSVTRGIYFTKYRGLLLLYHYTADYSGADQSGMSSGNSDGSEWQVCGFSSSGELRIGFKWRNRGASGFGGKRKEEADGTLLRISIHDSGAWVREISGSAKFSTVANVIRTPPREAPHIPLRIHPLLPCFMLPLLFVHGNRGPRKPSRSATAIMTVLTET